VEQAPVADVVPSGVEVLPVVGVVPWVVSARSEGALRGQARRLRRFAAGEERLDCAGVARALVSERSVFEHRAVVLGVDREDFLRGLDALASGTPTPGLVDGSVDNTAAENPLAVLFTGQGSQRAGMGRQLYAASPVFAAAFDDVCGEYLAETGQDLKAQMFSVDGATDEFLQRTEFAQPALFALEVALYRLVENCGVTPAFLLGHSVGELVAAHVSGAMPLPDAVRLVSARGRLMQALPPHGAMVALEASEQEARQLLNSAADGRVGLAAVNSPTSVVLSGDEETVLALARDWQSQGRRIRRLRVSHAFHSPLMDDMLDEFRQVAETVRFSAPMIPVVSNVTGEPVPEEEYTTPEYWVRHAREAVRFGDGMAWLYAQGVRTFLELGPDGTLSGIGPEALAACAPETAGEGAGAEALLTPALRADREETHAFVSAMAELFASGTAVDWSGVVGPGDGTSGLVDLPTYAFERERFWLEAGAGTEGAASGAGVSAWESVLWEAVGRGDAVGVGELLGVGVGASLESVVPALGVGSVPCR
ncbi:acyltransferase domain-containing protein, partial [Streptomyces stramineus]|uniref:acyltransferase domain-containing protein n=1 Tax=Streptomyces stramineus TaxID=173861 RepID=UPI0031D2F33A